MFGWNIQLWPIQIGVRMQTRPQLRKQWQIWLKGSWWSFHRDAEGSQTDASRVTVLAWPSVSTAHSGSCATNNPDCRSASCVAMLHSRDWTDMSHDVSREVGPPALPLFCVTLTNSSFQQFTTAYMPKPPTDLTCHQLLRNPSHIWGHWFAVLSH